MTARPTSIRAGSKARALYDNAHMAWRAGAISGWYYGKRSPSDPTVVWTVDGIEYDARDLPGVAAAIDTAYARLGIERVAFGESWCGYRSLHVTYTDGSRLLERYDAGSFRVVRERNAAASVAA